MSIMAVLPHIFLQGITVSSFYSKERQVQKSKSGWVIKEIPASSSEFLDKDEEIIARRVSEHGTRKGEEGVEDMV